MSLSLLVHLAQSFQGKEEAGSEYSKLSEARSVFYWQAVLDMIARVKKQEKMWIPKEWLFRPEPELPMTECDSFIRQSELSGMTYLAEVDLRHGRLEAALKRFSKVDTAEASYRQAKIYTTMAAEAPSGDDRDYLELAREALCLTLDRLRGNQHNPLHHEVTELFDSVETRLNRSTLMRDPCESALRIRPGPEIPPSTQRSVCRTLYPILTPSESGTALHNLSAERAHVAASPDRIDVHLRALTLKHDREMNEIRELVRSLQYKVEELREEVAEVKEFVMIEPQGTPPDPASAPVPTPASSCLPNISPAPHQTPGAQYIAPAKSTTTKPGSATNSPTAKLGTVLNPGGADGVTGGTPFAFGSPAANHPANGAVKSVEKTSQDKQQSQGALSKAKPGHWECLTCLFKNEDSNTKCAACETPRPGAKQPVVKTATSAAAGASTISFVVGQGRNSKGQSLVDFFKFRPGQWECDVCLVKNDDGTTKCPTCKTPRPSFAQPEEKPATTPPSLGFTATPACCMFGAFGGLVDFASLASGSTNDMPFTKKTDGKTEFKWPGSGQAVFTSTIRNAEVTDLKTREEDEENKGTGVEFKAQFEACRTVGAASPVKGIENVPGDASR